MLASGCALAGLHHTAGYAQDAAPAAKDAGELVVTGSRIIREGYAAPTPTTVFGGEQLSRAASSSLLDTLITIPALAGSQTATTNAGRRGEGLAGVQAINLRGLGSNRVLVLLDGVRMSPSSPQNYVDTGGIPSQLVSRIDIVTGGASAVYGSDAVAGVVNFVLDRQFTGVKGEVSGGVTNYGDDGNYKLSLSAGFGFAGDRGHVLLSGERLVNDGIEGDGGRKWNRRGYGQITNPAYTATNGQPQLLVGPNSSPSNATAGGIIVSGPLRGTAFGVGGVPYSFKYGPILSATQMIGGDWQLANTSRFPPLDPGIKSTNLFSRISYDLTDNINAYAQWAYSRVAVDTSGSPQNLGGNATTYIIRNDNAFLPAVTRAAMASAGVTSVPMGSWNEDMPKDPNLSTRTANRVTAGFEGDFAVFDADWKWNAFYAYGGTHVSQRGATVIVPRVQQAIDAVVVTPANVGASGLVLGTVACRSTLTAPGNGCLPWNFMGVGVNSSAYEPGTPFYWLVGGGNRQLGDIEQQTFAASISGEPFSLWAGPISVAVSAEHRKDEINLVADEFSTANSRSGANYASLFGKQSVTEGAVEVVIPLAKDQSWARDLELSLAARFTDYQLSGFVTTYKVGMTYSPIDDIRFRATRSRDIRAPNIQDLFALPNSAGGVGIDRFLNVSAPTGARYLISGNPDLTPEKADTTGVGVVFQPSFFRGFSASVDYWEVDIREAIQPLTAQQVIDACFYSIVPALCSNIVRGGDGQISAIAAFPINLSRSKTRGIDVEATYRKSLGDVIPGADGELTLHGNMTFYLEALQDNPFSVPIDTVGQNIMDAVPDYKFNVTATYQLDPVTVSMTARGFPHGTINNNYIVCTSGCPASTAAYQTINDNYVAGRTYFDANISYRLDLPGNTSGDLFLSARNLFNASVPGVSSQQRANLYDLIGAVYRVGFRFKM
nr:TonB-dependent receptor [Sphingomonas bacterium]